MRPTFLRQYKHLVGFVKLEPVGRRFFRDSGQWLDVPDVLSWSHVFKMDLSSWSYTDSCRFGGDWPLAFLFDTQVKASGFVVGCSEWKSFAEVQVWFPPARAGLASENDVTAVEGGGREPITSKLPWLLQHYEGRAAQDIDAMDDDGDAFMEDMTRPLNLEGDAFEPAAVLDELYDRRFDMEASDVHMADFKVQVRGGAWTTAHSGLAYDGFRAFAWSYDAKSF